MTLPPGYGETPVPDDDLELLLLHIRSVLDEPISKAAVYDLEQAIQAEVDEALIEDVLDGRQTLDDLLSDQFHVTSTLPSTATYGPGQESTVEPLGYLPT